MQIHPGEDTLNFVDRVLKYTVKNTDVGFVKNAFCDTFFRVPIKDFEPETYFSIFEKDSGTATCGLVGKLMVKILLDNGIDAYTYNFGFDNSMFTHIVVLVKHGGEFLIYDPLFNYTLCDERGKPIGLFRLFNQIIGDSLKVRIHSDSAWSDVVINVNDLEPFRTILSANDGCPDILFGFEQIRESTFKQSKLRCYQCNEECNWFDFRTNFETELKQETLLNEFHEGMILKINSVSGANDEKRIDYLIDSVLATFTNPIR